MDEKLYQAALKAYGINDKFVISKSYDKETKTVTIVTNGGKKVRYKDGDTVEPLDEISITGINPKAAKRKPIAGKERKGRKEDVTE